MESGNTVQWEKDGVIMTEGIRQDVGGVEEQEQIDLWLNAIVDERVVKKRDGKKAKKKGGW